MPSSRGDVAVVPPPLRGTPIVETRESGSNSCDVVTDSRMTQIASMGKIHCREKFTLLPLHS